MIGAYFLGNQCIETRPLVLPEPGEGQVLVKVSACGVCGTDVHIYHGGKGSAEVVPPVILGHEFSGHIVKLGSGVTGLEEGQLITVDPNIYCGKCRPCRQGQKQMCHHMRAVGVNMDGGCADDELHIIAHVLGPVADKYLYAVGAHAPDVLVLVHVGAGDDYAHILQHLGQLRHGDAAHSDQVSFSAGRHIVFKLYHK